MKDQRHMLICDTHIPRNCALGEVAKYALQYKPTHFIFGGDILNLDFASHWNTDLFKNIGWEKVNKCLNEEILAGKRVINAFVDVLPKDCKKSYIPGNHEFFLVHCANNYPGRISGVHLESQKGSVGFRTDLTKRNNIGLARMLDRLLDLPEMGIECLPYNQNLRIGNLTYLHGHQFSTMSAMKKKYPAQNIVAGHLHTHQVETIHNSGMKSRANQYVFCPGLCEPAPGYLLDGSTRWLNGFWVADVLPNGLFDGRVVKVLNGRVIAK